ncbi:uncharacterized protein TRIADDRAFT_61240 [Trichoplax adhaerens]|uniref:EamA domain-containing protein n=1 Tax=Trichoplax adhaerens TaxID=10228 RepID=B3SAF4_TRIAD|nr:hypothetical protein TRIADDRAFT_61240 [Trichoplax adhaerens]EDV20249.1 hypothetical protein TRIADDRAFT_61240 [Trichoplax adhaerens]|eukprot:XP_002117199.1 hypothetical protein TRIADDRAFT_61240 [Trichoplax adhaerens]
MVRKMKANNDQESLNSYDAAIESEYHRTASKKEEIDRSSNQSNYRKIVAGVCLVLGLAICRAGMAQFGRNLYTNSNFTASSLVTWSSRSTGIIVYPMVVMIMILTGHSYEDVHREGCKIFGKTELSIKDTAKKILPLMLISISATYFNFYALSLTSATNVTAVTSTSAAFVYVLSLIWLKEPFLVIRMLAVCTAIAGVILIAYSEGFGSYGSVGIVLATANAICSAFYRVFTKKVIGQATVVQSSLFLSILSFQLFLLCWIPIPILISTKVEAFTATDFPTIPFLITTLALLGYASILTVGIGLTYPIYMSMGPLLAIPINVLIDVFYEKLLFDTIKIVGTLAVVLGFLILTIPIPIIASFSSRMRLKIVRLFN